MHHNGFADGKQEIFIPVVGHIKLHAVVLAVLHHNHGIIVPDGGFQQALGGIGIGRDDDLGAGEVGDDRVQILGVLGGGGPAGADGGSDDHRDIFLSAGHVAHLGHLIDNLIHSHQHKVREHNLHDGPHARKGHADAHANNAGLADGGILHPQITVLLIQSLGAAPSAVTHADVLADHHHHGIPGHFLVQGLPHGVTIINLSHLFFPLSRRRYRPSARTPQDRGFQRQTCRPPEPPVPPYPRSPCAPSL